MYLFLWNVLRLTKRKNKTPFITVEPLYQRIGSYLAAYRHRQFLLPFCAGTLNFLGSNCRPHEITFRFPSHPSVDLFKRLPQRIERLWYSLSFNKTSPTSPPPIQAFTSQDCSIFQTQCKPCICIAVVFFNGWISTRIVPKTRTEILSAPVCLREHAIHHAVHWSQVMNDNLPTCDRAMDLVENDLGNSQYIQFPSA